MANDNGEHRMYRLLIIDDDVDLALSLKEILQTYGFSVEIAYNGREGIVMQKKNQYDLIITDIIMPEMDGLEVIMWVRVNSPTTKIIVVSGGGYFDSMDYLKMAKELGAHCVIQKPFEIDRIKFEIERLLK